MERFLVVIVCALVRVAMRPFVKLCWSLVAELFYACTLLTQFCCCISASEMYYWCVNAINCTGKNMSEGLLWALGEADANMYLCWKELRPSEQKLYIITFSSSVLTDWLTDRIYSPENPNYVAQAFKTNRGRLSERHEYLSVLAAFTTKLYNTGAQIHKKHKNRRKEKRKTHLVYKLTRIHVQKKISYWLHNTQYTL